ncbi:hypothetical protein [Cohaesibacter haloalkalitolerans]|uniref:hypothetical protein n=1 Tax=Cohaesibacter haloalkalitolerans TaxID=1162980 RepID=UPI000E6497E8|nr:hypothetical protein [Cohaesibacter haloalkalitolerans]
MFKELLDILIEGSKGVSAYKKCASVARERAVSNPDHAVCYFLFGIIAQDFADKFDREPLSSAVAKDQFDRIENYAKLLGEAFGSGTAEEQVAALNSVAKDIVPQIS